MSRAKLSDAVACGVVSDAVYSYDAATRILGLDVTTLRRACRLEGLRYAEVGNQRKLFRGSWLIEWIESRAARAGEVRESDAAA